MADVIHRTTLQHLRRVNTPDYPFSDWIGGVNVDGTNSAPLNLAAVSGVAKKHWKIVGDTVAEMSQAEKDAVDAAEAVASTSAKEAAIKSEVLHDPLEGFTIDIQASGLTLTVNINSIVVDDITTVAADPTNTKTVNLCYVLSGDTLAVQAFEKTTGEYAALAAGDRVVKDLGEWTVPANGTTLTGV